MGMASLDEDDDEAAPSAAASPPAAGKKVGGGWKAVQISFTGSRKAQAASIGTTTVAMGGSPAEAAAEAANRVRGDPAAGEEEIQIAAGLASSVAVLAGGGSHEEATQEAMIAAMEAGASETKAHSIAGESLEAALGVVGPMLATEPDREKVRRLVPGDQ